MRTYTMIILSSLLSLIQGAITVTVIDVPLCRISPPLIILVSPDFHYENVVLTLGNGFCTPAAPNTAKDRMRTMT